MCEGRKGGGMIKLQADKITIRGPRIDGSYVVSFEVGEYMRKQVAELLALDTEQVITVEVKGE